MGVDPITAITVEQYLVIDEAAERPIEYHDGELFPIVDASNSHKHVGV